MSVTLDAAVANRTRTRRPELRVLASGSAGNCSVLRTAGATLLIDAGLSPRRTRRLLEDNGIGIGHVDGIVLTHLDSDHFHAGWPRALPAGVPVYLHERHEREARSRGLARGACRLFDKALTPALDCCAFALLCDHDDVGTVSFRFEFTCGASLGFATDVGRVTEPLTEHLDRVDVLAVESNYCPVLQESSARPAFLKRRVTGGNGHLSNQEAAVLVERVRPREHVVLLHLSRECNDPALAASLHEGRGYGLTVARQHEPTAWIGIRTRRAEVVVKPAGGAPAPAA